VRGVPSGALTHPKYRADIDGLRAVAVLSVVGYHAFPTLVGGGFIGVDIFLVISGFLISSILFENLQANRFSFSEFYSRRIRRIFPALVVVLSAVLILGWFWLLADEYQQLGKHIFGGSAFVSNFMFLEESEHYFDNAAETKSLLHLWSLGIEEQFYIVWPLLLWCVWKHNYKWTAITIPVLTVSLILNFAIARRHPAADFFLPITRFWELSIGTLLADPKLDIGSIISNIHKRFAPFSPKLDVTRVNNLQEIGSLFGFFLIGVGLLVIDQSRLYPFSWALLPTLGGALIIASSARTWFNRTILANRVLVWFGLISYPLYLWHWPLLSFATILEAGAPPTSVRIAVVILSILLAWLTYVFIERPIRFGKYPTVKTFGAITGMVAAGSIGWVIFAAAGLPSRLQSQIAIDLINYNFFNGRSEEDFWKTGCFNFTDGVDLFRRNGCEQKGFPGRPTVFLIGDSYSAYLSLGLRTYLHEAGLNLFQYSMTNCARFSITDSRERCRAINAHIFEMLKKEKPEVLMMFDQYMAGRTPSPQFDGLSYSEYLLRKMGELKNLGVSKIVFLGQMPNWEAALPKVLLRRFVRWDRPVPERTYEGIDRASLEMDDILRRQKYPRNVVYVSLRDNLCNSAGCVVKVGSTVSKDLIVWDRGHLTPSGAYFVSENILAKAIR
jgi:peptidoglycan/LPS O-acetylase OafA/YrhL